MSGVWRAPAPGLGAASAAVAAQIQRVRQGISRLLDTYTDGYVEKADFETRMVHLKQRLAAFEEQARQLEDAAQQRAQLQLVIGRLEAFAAQVNAGLEHLDWSARRELIRTLVKRVEHWSRGGQRGVPGHPVTQP